MNEIERLEARAEASEANFATQVDMTRKLEDMTRKLEDMLKMAWGLIANAYGGDWDLASDVSGWKAAAERWRDRYHDQLPLVHGDGDAERPRQDSL